MATALIGLGSNLGERQQLLEQALASLAADEHVQPTKVSQFLETAPIGGPSGQGAFMNAAATFETSYSAHEFSRLLHDVEAALGRERRIRWDQRTIDLDLLLFDDQIISTPELTVPHPRMSFRRFVLGPAAEIAGEWEHPETGWTLSRHLQHLDLQPTRVLLVSPSGDDPACSSLRDISRLVATELAQVIPSVQILEASEEHRPAGLSKSDLDGQITLQHLHIGQGSEPPLGSQESDGVFKIVVTFENAKGDSNQIFEDFLASSSLGPALRLRDPTVEIGVQEVKAAIEAMD